MGSCNKKLSRQVSNRLSAMSEMTERFLSSYEKYSADLSNRQKKKLLGMIQSLFMWS